MYTIYIISTQCIYRMSSVNFPCIAYNEPLTIMNDRTCWIDADKFVIAREDCTRNWLNDCTWCIDSAHKAGGSAAGGYCLNLSTQSLTVQTCVVLAKVLATDRTFTDIRFDDCLLTEEGNDSCD